MSTKKLLIIILTIIIGISSNNLFAANNKKKCKELFRKAKSFERKDLIKCVTFAAEAVQQKSDIKRISKYLVKRYNDVVSYEKKWLNKYNSSNDEFKNDNLYYLYQKLIDMHEALAKVPKMKHFKSQKFEIHNYKEVYEKTATLAADAHFNKALNYLKSNNYNDLTNAYNQFSFSGRFIPNYKNYKAVSNKNIIDKANKLFKSTKRADKITATRLYKNLIFDNKDITAAQYKTKAKNLEKDLWINVYVNGFKGGYMQDNKNLVKYLGDNDFKMYANAPLENLENINTKANVLIYAKSINYTNKKTSSKVNRKLDCIGYRMHETYYDNGKTVTRTDKTVNKGDGKLLYAIYKKAYDNQETAKKNKTYKKDDKTFYKIKGTLYKMSKIATAKANCVFEVYNTKTGKKLKTINFSKNVKCYKRCNTYTGNKKAIPYDEANYLTKKDINIIGRNKAKVDFKKKKEFDAYKLPKNKIDQDFKNQIKSELYNKYVPQVVSLFE